MLTVSDLLKSKGPKVYSIGYDATIKDALLILAKEDVGALPVLKDGELVGIFSERDYARQMATMEECSMDAPISKYMTTKVFFVKCSNRLNECMQLMTEKRIRHLPVMDEGELAGIVSIGDLVKAVNTGLSERISHLENYIQGKW